VPRKPFDPAVHEATMMDLARDEYAAADTLFRALDRATEFFHEDEDFKKCWEYAHTQKQAAQRAYIGTVIQLGYVWPGNGPRAH
jgi:hypothetical protein